MVSKYCRASDLIWKNTLSPITHIYNQQTLSLSHLSQGERQEAERKVVLLEEQVGELQKEALNSAADSAAALEAASHRSLQEIAALKVSLGILHCPLKWPAEYQNNVREYQRKVWCSCLQAVFIFIVMYT